MRELAIWITSSGSGDKPKFLVLSGVGLMKAREASRWKDAERISLMADNIKLVPEWEECPKLVILLLQGNENLDFIPQITFFQCTPELRILHLSHTNIESLLCSVSHLVNLRADAKCGKRYRQQ
ncbi:hypothetical protein AMTR_s00050p00214010 [Amborella trichopoda]|uniref:NB-ARC domain-containing protein n=1 Tax=Amborella trichopoda TaxID=13333 RepID=W1PXG2_AMBTC|nr:hypothetical protein AMTR_s00050p00214010 [Amborella trichopoda]